MWHNLGEYVEKAVAAHRGCLTPSAGAPADGSSASAGPGPCPPPAEPEGLRDVCGRDRRLVARTRDRHAAVHGLLAAGHSQRAAAGILGLSRNTINPSAAAAAGQLLVKATSRPSKLDRYRIVIAELACCGGQPVISYSGALPRPAPATARASSRRQQSGSPALENYICSRK